MYTHPGGYKYCVTILPNGHEGTYLSVYLLALPGEFDDQLDWPVSVSCTIKLRHVGGEAPVAYTMASINDKRPNTPHPCGGNHSFVTQDIVESKHLQYDCLSFDVSIELT